MRHIEKFPKVVTLFPTVISISRKPLVVIAVFLFFLSGCATTANVKKVQLLDSLDPTVQVLLMPMDVELSLLTAAGLMEPQAEWTQNAIGHMTKSLERRLASADYRLLHYPDAATDPATDVGQLQKLHETLGSVILQHHLGMLKLPTKGNGAVFDWTLGEKAELLKELTGADYALFVYVRDSYSTGGRVAMQLGLALLGVGIQGGMQLGFASLVDLSSGDVVWFNRLISSSGDLREQEPADQSVLSLMSDFPGLQPQN